MVEGVKSVRLALVCCANGLGHVKRMVRVVARLAEQLRLHSVVFYSEENQLKKLGEWSEFRLLCDRVQTAIISVKLPLVWRSNEAYYSEWLLNWHHAMASWRLEDFDHVISDNLVEPLHYANRVTLMGSFLWHEVLYQSFPNSEVIWSYRERCKHLLLSMPPDMIANRYFATTSVVNQTKLHKVGLIHFCQSKEFTHTSGPRNRALVALGGAELGDGPLEQAFSTIPLLKNANMKVLASRDLCNLLASRYRGIECFRFWNGDFSGVDCAIIRGGLGTISDCIAAKVPMFYLDDANPEIAFNQTRLRQMGIGLPVRKLLKEGQKLLMDDVLFQNMRSRMSGLNLRGEIEAADVLWRLLKETPSGPT